MVNAPGKMIISHTHKQLNAVLVIKLISYHKKKRKTFIDIINLDATKYIFLIIISLIALN